MAYLRFVHAVPSYPSVHEWQARKRRERLLQQAKAQHERLTTVAAMHLHVPHGKRDPRSQPGSANGTPSSTPPHNIAGIAAAAPSGRNTLGGAVAADRIRKSQGARSIRSTASKGRHRG